MKYKIEGDELVLWVDGRACEDCLIRGDLSMMGHIRPDRMRSVMICDGCGGSGKGTGVKVRVSTSSLTHLLTKRQYEVLWLRSGLGSPSSTRFSQRAIARQLGITKSTVNDHEQAALWRLLGLRKAKK